MNKLLAAVLAGLLLGGYVGKTVGNASGAKAAAAAEAKGRGDGCTVAAELLTPFGDQIHCAVEDGALYLEGEMVKGGKFNLDAALAKAKVAAAAAQQ